MKVGKIPETVLRRTVLKQIIYQKNEIVKGAGIGADCAFFAAADMDTGMVFSTQTMALPVKNAVKYGIITAVNNIATGYGEPIGIMLSITLPPLAEEVQLKELMKLAGETAKNLGVQIMGGHTEVSDGVSRPVFTVTAVGTRHKGVSAYHEDNVEAHETGIHKAELQKCDIVLSKWIGMEGSVMLAEEQEEKIRKRYPERMIKRIKGFEVYLSVINEAAIASMSGACAMHDVRGGGIFGALWELSQSAGTGLEINLKKIPVKQETVELCELLHINPYELISGGALLMCTKDTDKLLHDLNEEGIAASVIGSFKKHNDKVIINDGEVRYLGRPKGDEIYKALSNLKTY